MSEIDKHIRQAAEDYLTFYVDGFALLPDEERDVLVRTTVRALENVAQVNAEEMAAALLRGADGPEPIGLLNGAAS